jgi:hypothetical protein
VLVASGSINTGGLIFTRGVTWPDRKEQLSGSNLQSESGRPCHWSEVELKRIY